MVITNGFCEVTNKNSHAGKISVYDEIIYKANIVHGLQCEVPML